MEKDLNVLKINLNQYEIPISNQNDEKINEIVNKINKDLEMKI